MTKRQAKMSYCRNLFREYSNDIIKSWSINSLIGRILVKITRLPCQIFSLSMAREYLMSRLLLMASQNIICLCFGILGMCVCMCICISHTHCIYMYYLFWSFFFSCFFFSPLFFVSFFYGFFPFSSMYRVL